VKYYLNFLRIGIIQNDYGLFLYQVNEQTFPHLLLFVVLCYKNILSIQLLLVQPQQRITGGYWRG